MPTITVTGDVSTTGWEVTPPGPLFDALDEASQSNADYISAQFGTPDPVVFSIPYLGPGTHSVSVAASVEDESTSFRVLLQNSAGTTIGTSDWQDVTPGWAVYVLPVTIASGVASRLAIELATYPIGLMSITDGPISITDGYVSFV